MSCPKCKKFTKVLNKIKDTGFLKYCQKCKLIYAKNYYWGMEMDGEMHSHESGIMVESPAWKKLVKDIELPEGQCVDYRYEKCT